MNAVSEIVMDDIVKKLDRCFTTPLFKGNFAQKYKNISIMNEQMIIWCAIVGVLMCTFVLRGFLYHRKHTQKSAMRHHRIHLIEIGKEKAIFYLPGDRYDEEDY